MKSVIYALFFPNDKLYIVQTNNFNKRMNAHKKMYKGCHNLYLSNAIKKYGWENIKKEVLIECDKECVDFFERAFISGYNSTNEKIGYNLESGGNKNKIMSDDTKEKLSIAHTGKKASQETKNKMSSFRKGNKICASYGFKGKKHSIETKEKMKINATGRKFSKQTLQKMSVAKIGKMLSSSHREKISNSLIGHEVTKEVREKISINHIGKKNPMYGKKPWNYGKHLSEETKKKISETKLKNRKK